ncbi:solute carrier family 2, facilitated glucose transporter member 1-like [Paramacrobiotus metropolitanus]|uniref:solute carrier family 2, facilitated glucose transporter member 1-like n=1 Tax=Paramacrobiotus metropolitanus TaxID=2943436 RepID=UPI002445E1A5|nr:solute carrier family 2, facilitated glucose transporter member 1-like [Paramacrobiotus metropolitanus]
MSDQGKLTGKLAVALFASTFGTWFPHGLSVSALNGPQNIVLNWIRSVKCVRWGGQFAGNYTNNTDLHDPNHYLWCRTIPQAEEKSLKQNYELYTLWALCSSMLCVGALIGTLLTNLFIHGLGIKKSLMLGAVILLAGCVLCSFGPTAGSWELFLLGRIVIGLGTGLVTVVTPIYTSEITPAKLRGAAGTLPPVMYVLGLIVTTAIGFPYVLGHETGWPYLVSAVIIPVVIACAILPFCPESPRYLYIEKSREADAQMALMWFRGAGSVKDELEEMHTEAEHLKGTRNVTLLGLFVDPFLRKICWLVAVPMLAHQFCGFYCVTFYSTSIFDDVGLKQMDAVYATMGVWVVYLIALLTSMALVDRLGRRTLLLISHLGMIVALVLFVVFAVTREQGVEWTKYGSAACMPLFIASFATGSASVPWILPGELFPQEAHNSSASLVAAVSWAGAILTTLLFPLIVVVAKHYTFLIFAGLVALATVHIVIKLPETKGKTIEEIQALLRSERQTR